MLPLNVLVGLLKAIGEPQVVAVGPVAVAELQAADVLFPQAAPAVV